MKVKTYIIEKTKNFLEFMNKPITKTIISKEDKINTLVDIIDSIKIEGNNITIKTSKNILLENDGHLITLNSGLSVNISKEIHFNPDIKFNMSTIDKDIEESKVILEFPENKCLH